MSIFPFLVILIGMGLTLFMAWVRYHNVTSLSLPSLLSACLVVFFFFFGVAPNTVGSHGCYVQAGVSVILVNLVLAFMILAWEQPSPNDLEDDSRAKTTRLYEALALSGIVAIALILYVRECILLPTD